MELYIYKVIYPNGVYVRLTPDLNAEKTGDVLPFGSIIESTKSLILDGINYVQLKDGKGWVFSSKGERSVLDLIEVIRTNSEKPTIIQSTNPKLSTPQKELNTDISHSKAETPRRKPTLRILPSTPSSSKKLTQNQSLWKEIRNQVRNSRSFNDISIILTNESYSDVFPPKVTEPGPARCAWLTSAEGSDHKLRVIVSVLASITRQCIDNIADVTGLEQHLWLFVNLGSQDVHFILSLADESAKVSFDRLSRGLRVELLNHTNELARLTKVQSIEASRLSELLSDDIRHFLQRWTCIKVKTLFLFVKYLEFIIS